MGIVRAGGSRHVMRGIAAIAIVLGVSGVFADAGSAAPAPVGGSGSGAAGDLGVGGFIVGGDPVAVGQFPSLAAIMLDEPDLPARFRLSCSGTVVTPRWILTAGHCSIGVLFGDPIVVQTGSRDLGAQNAQTQTVKINRAVVHRTYFSRGVAYDVALLHTQSHINAPVSRLATPADAALAAGGRSATAAGWGLTKQLGIQEPPRWSALPPRRARSVEIPLIDDTACDATYEDFLPGYFVGASDVCAGTDGKNVCYGDSGGPLYAKDPQGALVQIGITSRGAGCANKLFPAIFTEVSRVQAWIQRYTTHQCTNKVEFPTDPEFPDDDFATGPLYVC